MTPRQRLLLIVPGVLFLVALGAFELGQWGGRKIAEQEYTARLEGALPADSAQDDRTLVRMLLAQNLGERTFEFRDVLEAATGRTILPFDPAKEPDATILKALISAADVALETHNEASSPLRSLRRINEGSRYFEETLRTTLDAHPELFCTIPETADGVSQRSGYPDLRIEHVESGRVAYLDPKLFEEGSRESTYRSFYYTPQSETSKVQDDAHHLLLGFSHDGRDGEWTFTSWELIDLSKLQLNLKAEFHASNREIYREDARVASSQEEK